VLTYLPGALAYVRARLRGLLGREEGVTAVEYALMVAIIAVLLVGAFYTLFNTVGERYSEVGDCIASGPDPGTCNPGLGEPPPGGGG
jgi:Flp pilus assembly pilin Flp